MKSLFAPYLVALTLVTTSSFGQAVNQKMETAKRNPSSVEAAAQADVGLIDQKNIVGKNSLDSVPPQIKGPGYNKSRKKKKTNPQHK